MNWKNILLFTLAIFLLIPFTACDIINPPDDPPDDDDDDTIVVIVDSLGISVSEFHFTAEQDAGLLVVRSNTSWTANENADWITLTATSGTKNTGFLIGAATNEGIKRTATVTITAGDKTKELKVIQAGAPFLQIPVNSQTLKMVLVEGGQFTMGSNDHPGFGAPHKVQLSDYYISETEVTNACWLSVNGKLPYKDHDESAFPHYPVTATVWDTVTTNFLPALNRLTGYQFTLPTEAQWEYAALGGKLSHNYKYSGRNELDAVAWFWKNSSSKKKDVKGKAPNELGLYDMSGNANEWCSDWYDPNYGVVELPSLQTDPAGPATGTQKVVRGGDILSDESWGFSVCNVKYRNKIEPSGYNKSGSTPDVFLCTNTGFRLVLKND